MTDDEFRTLAIGDKVRKQRGNVHELYELQGRVAGDPNGAPYFRRVVGTGHGIGRAHLFYAEEIERAQAPDVLRAHDHQEAACTATTPTAGATAPSTGSKRKRVPRLPRGTSPAR